MAKRLFDILVAGSLLAVLWPVMVLVAFAVRINLGSPVLYAAVRPGRSDRPFRMFKFRTMTEARDVTGSLLPDEQRLTRFGRWLRATSLDELPELWNVVIGDMSLVGPRPLLVSYLEHYSPEQRRRHLVRPGITGWAQINGRNAIDWEEKFKHDVWYVDNRSFWFDLKILALTFGTLLRREGISAPDHATMPMFRGNAKPAPGADSGDLPGSLSGSQAGTLPRGGEAPKPVSRVSRTSPRI